MSRTIHCVDRRTFLRTSSALATAGLTMPGYSAGTGEKRKVDVCIYGGTAGGVVAAVALAKLGRAVVIVEPSRHLGAMTAGGLGWIDIKIGEAPYGGLARAWIEEMKKGYAAAGVDTKKFGNTGWVCEPHVAEKLFEKWIADQRIEVIREARLASVTKTERRLRSIMLDKAPPDKRGAPADKASEQAFLEIEAAMFIDCSYEGDLLAAAGVSWRGDREGRDEYGESAAGLRWHANTEFGETVPPIDPYVRPGDANSGLLPLVSAAPLGEPGARSSVLQAYNFRLCLVKDQPLPVEPPSDYDPKRFEIVARHLAALAAGKHPIEPADFHRSPWRLLKISPLPKGKTDVNNAGLISMDFVTGQSERYAGASWAERAKLWHAHEDYQRGFLYFLRTDERVPEGIRTEVAKWGLPRDEFRDTGGWPFQLYIREARRMVGTYVMKQSDCENPPAKLADSVGLGTYSLDSHGCQRVVKDGHVVHEGGFLLRLKGPYPIPYRVLTPRAEECENLLVTFCVSSSHVAFASLRMEPQLMILSESAALAADQALREGTSVQAINVEKLSQRLRDAGQRL